MRERLELLAGVEVGFLDANGRHLASGDRRKECDLVAGAQRSRETRHLLVYRDAPPPAGRGEASPSARLRSCRAMPRRFRRFAMYPIAQDGWSECAGGPGVIGAKIFKILFDHEIRL